MRVSADGFHCGSPGNLLSLLSIARRAGNLASVVVCPAGVENDIRLEASVVRALVISNFTSGSKWQ